MNHPPDSERAISDVFGAVILIGVIVTVFAVAGVMMFSQPQPQKIPALNAIISNNTQTIEIHHGGGDSFNFADVQILLDGQPTNFTKDGTSDWSTGTWSVGQSLTYDVPAGQAVPSSIQIVYKGGGVPHLIAQSGEGGASTSGTLPVPAPVVTAITPNTGPVGTVVSITDLAGSSFFNGATVKLIRAGSADITAYNVVVVSATKITCDFDLTGSTPGGVAWDVVVTNPDGPSGTLANAFTMTAALPPVADFNGTPLSGTVPLTVSFTDSSTNSPEFWLWEFGEGNTSSVQNPIYTYLISGTYTVNLTVTNDMGSSKLVRTSYITVNPVVYYTINATATPPGGSISPSGAVSVLAGNSQNFTISADTGYHIADVLVDSVSQGIIPNYTFTNVVTNHTINATFAINQYTINATSGPNGNVTPAGETLVNYGSNQAYNITPITGYHVADVLVNNASVGAVTTYEFTNVAANQTINATFAINQYTITPSITGGNGVISPDTVQTVDYGATPTFNFTPALNYHLHNITVNGFAVSPTGNNSYTFPPVTANKTIVGMFRIDPPVANFTGTPLTGGIPLNVTFTDLSTNSPTSWVWNFGDGNLAFEQNPTNTYVAGGNYSVRLEATNAGGTNVSVREGYIFTYIPAVANFTGSPTSGPVSLTVYFTDRSTGSPSYWHWNFGDFAMVNTSTNQNPGHTYDNVGLYSVNLTVANSFSSSYLLRTGYINATVAPPVAAIYNNTDNIGLAPLTVEFWDMSSNDPTSYLWHFDDGTPDETTMDATHTFTNPGIYNVSHTATNIGGSSTAYMIVTATGLGITASSGPNGNVTPAGETLVAQGGSQAYSITPITGYKIANVLVDGVSNGTISSYTFSNVQTNHTISATFAIRTFNITASSGANGNVTPSGVTTVNYGGNQTYTITPISKYHTQTLVVDGVTVATYPPKIASTYNFTNVQDNHTISATFAKNLREQIFYDPFDITPGSNGWTIVSNPDWQTAAPVNGTRSIRFRGSTAAGPDEAISRSISTSGYSEINMEYRLQAQSLESGEYFTAQYSTNGGSSYSDLTRYNGIYAGNTTMFPIYTPATLPTAADNQASNFWVRFGIWGSNTGDYGWVDDVKITGIPNYI